MELRVCDLVVSSNELEDLVVTSTELGGLISSIVSRTFPNLSPKVLCSSEMKKI